MDNRAETSLALDNDVGNTHLPAEGGEEDDEFDGVDIVSNDNKGSLLRLNESNTVVETVLDKQGFLGILSSILALSSLLSLSSKTSLLLLLSLGAVLVQELEQLGSSVLVESVGELGNGGGNLETLVKDNFLALKDNVFRPFHETGQVSDRLDVLA